MTAERLDMPVDGEADRRAQALQRAILDHLLAGREYELQFRSIDDVDLGRPVAILFRDRWKERRSEEHTSELQSLMRISYAVFCLKKKKKKNKKTHAHSLEKTTHTYD